MKRIHFMGIGGVGMSGLALLLSKAGHKVSGCDKYSSPRTRWLEENGIVFSEGHSAAHLTGIDELIVTPAVPPSAPELAAARAAGIPVRYRGEVLAEVVNNSYGIAVCGTHGKTTTSTFITKLLRELGDSPSWCIGGETGDMPVAGYELRIKNDELKIKNDEFRIKNDELKIKNDELKIKNDELKIKNDELKIKNDELRIKNDELRIKNDELVNGCKEPGNQSSVTNHQSPLIVEADESDGTLALYRPKILVLNAVDFDHLEHFDSPEAYFDCYRTAIRNTSDLVIVCAEHPKALELARESLSPTARLVTFGFSPACDVTAADYPELSSVVCGRHNILNALAAIAVAQLRIKNDELRIKKDEFRIKKDEFRIKNDELRIKNDEFRIKNDELVNNCQEPGIQSPVTDHQSPITNHQLTNKPINQSPSILNSEFSILNLKRAFGELPDRRFQTIVKKAGVTVITDYAHHPAELACAVAMARDLKPRRLRVLFQPHRYSRTRALLNEFPPAFAAADEVVLIPVYAAFEDPIPGGDIADLYKAFVNYELRIKNAESGNAESGNAESGNDESGSCIQNSKFLILNSKLKLARSADEAWKHAFLTAESGDLILIAGAGDVIKLLPRVRSDFESVDSDVLPVRKFTSLAPLSFFRTGGVTCGGGARVIVGMGSNTWFSDCASDIEIVKPSLPSGASVITDRPDLAFMHGIPGTIGGWVKMNAGAFGHSIGEFVRRVKVDGKWIDAADCGFAYRHSNITGLIEEVELIDDPSITNHQSSIPLRKTFPPRTCGSVFKNPAPDRPAGRLLDEAGAKSLSVGGASVWSEHANVIVAGENCTSSDILALARLMAAAVREKFNINLSPEIRGLLV